MEERHPAVANAIASSTEDQGREESKSVPSVSGASFAGFSSSSSASVRSLWGVSNSSPTSVVLTLLSNGADRDACNHDKYSALMVAAWRGHSAVVELLLAFKANLNARAEKGQTALMLATAQCHSHIAALIIGAGAQLNIVDEKNEAALHKASIAGDHFTAECLLNAGADISLKEHVHGNTALLLAAKHMHGGIVQLLLQRGAQADVRNHRGETPLLLACSRGHSYTAGVLIRGGADPSASDGAGNTPLLVAARAGSESVVELLLDLGAPIVNNHEEEGPLHAALMGGPSHAVVVELLTAAGADPIAACAHLNVPSQVGPLGDGASDAVLHALHPTLREAVERGLAGRERYEQRDRRYGDIIAAVKALRCRTTTEEVIIGSPGRRVSGASFADSSHSTPHHLPATVSSVPLLRHSSDLGPVESTPGAAMPSSLTARPLHEWTVPHVLAWLQAISLPQYTSSFSDASVDGEMLLELIGAEGDALLIHELKMERKIHRMKLIREIKKLVQGTLQGAQSAMGVLDQGGAVSAAYSDASTLASSNSPLVNTSPHTIPMTPSISNPLPTSSYAIPHDATSSLSLFPATGSSIGTGLPLAASSVAGASNGLIGPPVGLSIFSSKFDFDNLSALAPLSTSSSKDSQHITSTTMTSTAASPMQTAAVPPVDTVAPLPLIIAARQPSRQEYANMKAADLVVTDANLTGSRQSDASSTGVPSVGSGATPAPLALSPAYTSPAHQVPRPLGPARRIPLQELQFLSVIGEGQFGTVYLGTWRNVPVAIKKLHLSSAELSTTTEAKASSTLDDTAAPAPFERAQIQLFLQEAALMELLGNHPNLITFVGICVPEEATSEAASAVSVPSPLAASSPSVCIVTQYFPLGSIRDLLITRKTFHRLSPAVLAAVGAPISSSSTMVGARCDGQVSAPIRLAALLRMLRDIACGVLHLHLDHIIHRDIAARNALVDEFSLGVRVADFGMSRFLVHQLTQDEATSGFTQSHVGPLKWLAPESVLHHEYSEKTDSYAFGITMWEVLWCQDPYPNHRALEAAIQASHDPTFRPKVPDKCPEPIRRLMQQCWEHVPAHRPNFHEILSRLQQMEEHLKKVVDASMTDEWAVSTWSAFHEVGL